MKMNYPIELILTAAGEGIYGLDAKGFMTFVNPAAEKMTGYTAREMIGECQHKLTHHSKDDGTPYPVDDCPIYAAFKDGAVHHVSNEVFWRKDGTCFPVEYVSTPMWEKDKLVGAVVVFKDISERKQAEKEIQRLKNQLELENAYLNEEVLEAKAYGEIVGRSPALGNILAQIEMVAPTNASVLITGESGTGKELVAREIHKRSPRSERSMIKVNCASIPRELYESEFFGHVKGAFTGAIKNRTGRFELAQGGTLFLDEVGEIPLDLQSKLLRVLQEGTYERVGDEKTLHADVRVIAATNQNLKEDVQEKRFRQDLYYRLNVFPIEVPALRQRKEDIPMLAAHFIKIAARKLNAPLPHLTQANVLDLQEYDWPGNVRELVNAIERAVIVSQGGKVQFDLPDRKSKVRVEQKDSGRPKSPGTSRILTKRDMLEQERENILNALIQCNWKITGPKSAAEVLEMKPTTLYSRIKKLGIKQD
ncbi:MAG: hypothetical protein NPINA01_16290 [Nitrospinaceae bacterium]|nr:MAG: hypothetical protein NPINA01_16290 [Nitrospinaceae bacterium]